VNELNKMLSQGRATSYRSSRAATAVRAASIERKDAFNCPVGIEDPNLSAEEFARAVA